MLVPYPNKLILRSFFFDQEEKKCQILLHPVGIFGGSSNYLKV